MAIPKGSKYALIPIGEEWGHISAKQEYKNTSIYGVCDGFNGNDSMLITTLEHIKGDSFVVFDDAHDESGQRYLILKRDESI